MKGWWWRFTEKELANCLERLRESTCAAWAWCCADGMAFIGVCKLGWLLWSALVVGWGGGGSRRNLSRQLQTFF